MNASSIQFVGRPGTTMILCASAQEPGRPLINEQRTSQPKKNRDGAKAALARKDSSPVPTAFRNMALGMFNSKEVRRWLRQMRDAHSRGPGSRPPSRD